MKTKNEVFEIFVKFKAQVENRFNSSIKTLQCDEGGEYKSHVFQKYLATHGISQRFSCPKHPEQNGIAERKHRHIIETSIVMLSHAHIPNKYWVDACLTATYLINRLPSRALSQKSPYEHLYAKIPKYETLKVFGCQCYPWLVPYAQNKLQQKSKPCVFLGYSLNHQGYKCLDLSTRRIYLSRHVLFDDDTFPFKELTSSLGSVGDTGSITSPDLLFTFPLLSPSPQATLLLPSQPSPSLPQPTHITYDIPHSNNLLPPPPLPTPCDTPVPMPLEPSRSTNPSSNEQEAVPFPEMNQSMSVDDPGTTFSTQQPVQPARMTTRSQSGIQKRNPKYALHVHINPSLVEPTCFSQAIKHQEWRNAMVQEFNALQRCGT